MSSCPLVDGSIEFVRGYLSLFFRYELVRSWVQEMFLEAPLDVLLGVHTNGTEVLVSMGDYYILVVADFLENPGLELG